MDGAAACDAYAAVLRIRRHAVAVDGHIHIAVYGHIALFDLRKNACIVEAREYILTIERNTPLIRLFTCDLQIAVDADPRCGARFIRFFSKTVTLLDRDAVAAKAACHRDTERSVDGKLRRLVFHRIKLNGICQGIAAVKPSREDIDALCRTYREIRSPGIDSRRISHRVFHLQLQEVFLCADIKALASGCRNRRKHIRRLVAELILPDADNGITVPALPRRDRIGVYGIVFPDGILIACRCGRRSAQFRRQRHDDGCRRAVDPVRLDHRDLVEAAECLVLGEILRLPYMFRRIIAVRIGLQSIAKLQPETLRIVFGVELAEPSLLFVRNGNLRPIVGMFRHQIGHGRLVDMRIDLAAAWAEIVRHDVGSAVRQDLQIAHILAGSLDMLWNRSAALLRAQDAPRILIDLGDVERRIVGIARPVIVLIAADAGNEDMVVELIESALIDVAADARIAAELQGAVVLDVVLHQEAVIVGIIAPKRIDGRRHIEPAPLDEQRLTVHLCFCRVTRVGFVFLAL